MSDLHKIYNLYLNSTGISIDSRTTKKGNLFVALRGENFDGNKYAADALEKGAAVAIVDKKEVAKDNRFIVVTDTLHTLQKLASHHLKQLNIPVLAITGTNGKTTTKELVAAVLSSAKNIHYTIGNLNNHIGVPLTILSTPESSEMLVLEMGANHPGEIAALCRIAPPYYGLITNIGKAHLEGFGSFEGVLKTKKELYEAVAEKDGLLFVNADDPLLSSLSENIKRFTYGKKKADVTASTDESTPYIKLLWNKDGKTTPIATHLYGAYNFYNVLAAVATGVYFGIPDEKIVHAIESYIPQNNRSQIIDSPKNRIILDAYNANPVSMSLALQSFAESNFPDKMIVLGDMFELGEAAQEEHAKILNLIEQLGFKDVVLVGGIFSSLKESAKFQHFETTNEACDYLKKIKPGNRTILIKGSRGMQLELLINCL